MSVNSHKAPTQMTAEEEKELDDFLLDDLGQEESKDAFKSPHPHPQSSDEDADADGDGIDENDPLQALLASSGEDSEIAGVDGESLDRSKSDDLPSLVNSLEQLSLEPTHSVQLDYSNDLSFAQQ